jgi:hypothetical protein
MSGHIIKIKRYSRDDLKSNPDVLFVFGDNMAGTGLRGQAAACRGEPNAVGLPTKWKPGTKPAHYFTNGSLTAVRPVLNDAFRRLAQHLDSGGDVVWPADGVGTGLAELNERARSIAAYIELCFGHLCRHAAEIEEAEDGAALRERVP